MQEKQNKMIIFAIRNPRFVFFHSTVGIAQLVRVSP